MKRKIKHIERKKNDFVSDYNKIIKSSDVPVSIKTEWVRKGDFFQKFTMYDTNYKIIPSLDSIGSTTLIKKI